MRSRGWLATTGVGLSGGTRFSRPASDACLEHRGDQRRAWRVGARTLAALGWLLSVTVTSQTAAAEVVTVRHTEGLVHGFLVLRDTDGKALADGDLLQTTRGNRVTARLIFRFRDGSIHEETTVFAQGRRFRLLSHHLVQRGPTFPQPLDLSIRALTGEVHVRYTNDRGQEKTESDHLDLEADVANGLILTLLKNVRADAPPESFSFVAATPKPQLVKLAVSVAGPERFSIGSTRRTATHYVLKVDIGGLKGLLAALVGKQPPDAHVWILRGEAPAFVKSEQPLYLGGPVWRIELVSPTWGDQQSRR